MAECYGATVDSVEDGANGRMARSPTYFLDFDSAFVKSSVFEATPHLVGKLTVVSLGPLEDFLMNEMEAGIRALIACSRPPKLIDRWCCVDSLPMETVRKTRTKSAVGTAPSGSMFKGFM